MTDYDVVRQQFDNIKIELISKLTQSIYVSVEYAISNIRLVDHKLVATHENEEHEIIVTPEINRHERYYRIALIDANGLSESHGVYIDDDMLDLHEQYSNALANLIKTSNTQ